MIPFENLTQLTSPVEQPPLGEVSVLSIRRGDLKLSFNSEDPQEVEQARVAVRDLLSRGYMLFVDVQVKGKNKLVRVAEFDPEVDEYVLRVDKRSSLWKSSQAADKAGATEEETPPTRVSAKKTRATAVAPTAGG